MGLFELIEKSAKEDDLDAALKPIQDLLGQTDGGQAALFWDDLRIEYWLKDTFENRMLELAEYIKFEIVNREYQE